MLNIRKHVSTDNKTQRTPIKKTSTKRRVDSSIEMKHSRIKSSSVKQKTNVDCDDNEIIRLKNTNDLLMHEVQSLISTSSESIEKTNEIVHLQNEYERLNTQMLNLTDEQTDEILHKLEIDVENLLHQIQKLKQKKKTFADRLFEKYTIEYILTLNENDINQRIEQLEKENQLLLLIKQVSFICTN